MKEHIQIKFPNGHKFLVPIRIVAHNRAKHYAPFIVDIKNFDGDDKIEATDEVVEADGLKVVIDRKSLLYLYGTQLTYSDGLNGKGFQWENPNASRTCGCGESFSL
jgi:Fe-S cluster assembly iron-binding protein IscA